MDFDPGMPRKVLEWAQSHGGLHSDCLVATDPCGPCRATVVSAFDHFYGHHEDLGDVLEAISKDFRDEEQEKTS